MSIPEMMPGLMKSYLMVPLLFPLGMGMLNSSSSPVMIVQPHWPQRVKAPSLLIGHGCSVHVLTKVAKCNAEYVMNVNPAA